MSEQPVLVTGATGYIGSHVVHQLLQQGYTVRATVRPGREKRLLSIFPDAGAKLEAIEVESLTSDHSTAVNGVSALIHVANPTFATGVTGTEIVEETYSGTLNVLKAAIDAGVKKIVLTSTIVSLWNLDFKAAYGTEMLTADSYGTLSYDDIDKKTTDVFYAYQAAKTAADKDAWELVRGTPDVDLTAILPPTVWGPFVSNYPLPAERSGLRTTNLIYQLVDGTNTYPAVPIGQMIDVRDVAKAHILALTVPPLNDGRKKRFIICSKVFTYKEVAEVIRRRRPEVSGRLPNDDAKLMAQTTAPLDLDFAKEVLGMGEYINWEETVLASLDESLRWEKERNVKV